MPKRFFEECRPHNGLDYEEYLKIMEKRFGDANFDALDDVDKRRVEYTRLNYQRMTRIQRTYIVPDELRERLAAIEEPQLWMVLTEPWCGDSAQCLPYIAKFADCNPLIDLKILLRDDNLDIMEQYLTEGKRGIPKLVAFNEKGEELFHWGPRPQKAAELFKREREAGHPKDVIIERLHLWYGRNRGQAMEREFTNILASLNH